MSETRERGYLTVEDAVREFFKEYVECPDGKFRRKVDVEAQEPQSGEYKDTLIVTHVETDWTLNKTRICTNTGRRIELTTSLIQGRFPKPGDYLKAKYEITPIQWERHEG